MTVSSSSTNQKPNPALSQQGSGSTVATPAPKKDANPLASRVRRKLRESLEASQGACFRTEIRDSGVFICGVHQDAIWENESEGCSALELILDLAVESVVAAEAEQKAENRAAQNAAVAARQEEAKRQAAKRLDEESIYRRARDRGMSGTPWVDSRYGGR